MDCILIVVTYDDRVCTIWVNKETPENVVKDIFNVMHFGAITESMVSN